MEAQQDQEATTSTTARPQQPTDSLVASLPQETLAQILRSLLEGLDSWERQQARISFAKVCIGWYGAVDLRRELAVKDLRSTRRLLKHLVGGPPQRGWGARSLSIRRQKHDAPPVWTAEAQILGACPRLKSLQLVGGGSDRWLSQAGILAFRSALLKADRLESLDIDSCATLLRTSSDVSSLLTGLPKLQSFALTATRQIWRRSTFSAPSPIALTRLRLPLERDGDNVLLGALLASTTSTLLHLDLGKLSCSSTTLGTLPSAISSSLTAVAPRLLSLSIILERDRYLDKPFINKDYLCNTLEALKDVRSLSLGILGFSFAEILPLLRPLAHLHRLSIGQSLVEPKDAPFHELTAGLAVDFINGAVALKRLTLPRQLGQVWSKEELERVRSAAEQRGLWFLLG